MTLPTMRWRRRATRRAEAFREDERYWLARFAGDVPVLELPTDRTRPARRSFASGREDRLLDAELLARVRALGARHGVSLFATLLATFAALLSRLSGQDEVVIGIPTAGQAVDGHDHLVGHCVNTLPLRFGADPTQPPGAAIEAGADAPCSTRSSTSASPSAACCASCASRATRRGRP